MGRVSVIMTSHVYPSTETGGFIFALLGTVVGVIVVRALAYRGEQYRTAIALSLVTIAMVFDS